MSERVGLLGGTFDPIHYGHLLLAEGTRQELGLARVLFVPAGSPPHKLSESHSDPFHRLRMLRLAIQDNPDFAISRVDLDRPGPHYSADMVRLVQQELGSQIELFFLMGMDSLASILTWHEPRRLLEHCELAIANRPGYEANLSQIEEDLPHIRHKLHFISIPSIDIAGEELRRQVRAGRSIRYQLPEAVRQYIEREGLYLPATVVRE